MNPEPAWVSCIQCDIKQQTHIHTLIHHDTLDSTNKEAMRQAWQGSSSGLVILADKQSEGRGRLGRTWHTVDDALAMSVLLRPSLPATKLPQLSLVTAVALQDALSPLCPDIRIKWPNDLLIHGAKVAGILTEMHTQARQVEAVIIGMGVNLKQPEGGWPSDIQQRVTDLESHSQHILSREHMITRILHSLNGWYDTYLNQGFEPVRQAWWQAHAACDQTVRVWDGNTYIEGIAEALDENGALLLRHGSTLRRITSGEVFLSQSI